MKVVVYQGNKKFTVDNVTIPHIMVTQEEKNAEIFLNGVPFSNFNITSQNNLLDESEFFYDQDADVEGINWQAETLN